MSSLKMQISTEGGFTDVLASGTLVCTNNRSGRIQFEDLSFEVIFSEDTSGEQRVDLTGSGKVGKLTLLNFTNALGTAFRIQIGKSNNGSLMMDCFVHTISGENTARLLNFSFVREGAR